MNIKEAMTKRHTVRKFEDKPIEKSIVDQLNERIDENNKKHHIDMKLILNDESAFGAILKLILAKGVKNFIILAGDDKKDIGERLGYASADVMLYAQTLGLNTWWVGGTFNHGVASLVPGKKVIGVMAIGYGQNQGKPHKSKTMDQVSEYAGDYPEWFANGVKAALLAPTALNKQAFHISGSGSAVEITQPDGTFTGADLGLVKYHFELGAGKENFKWK